MATTTTTDTETTRTLAALMIFVVIFALIGNELKSSSAKSSTKTVSGVTTSGRIIIGGAIGTALLVLLSHAGDPGRSAAMGLATITFVTTTLVYGGPVWTSLSAVVGGNSGATPTTPTLGTSTGGTATTVPIQTATPVSTNPFL